MRPSYNGITLASQARDAGSTPVGRCLDKLDKDCYRFLVFDEFIKSGADGSRRLVGVLFYGLFDCGIPRFGPGALPHLKVRRICLKLRFICAPRCATIIHLHGFAVLK